MFVGNLTARVTVFVGNLTALRGRKFVSEMGPTKQTGLYFRVVCGPSETKFAAVQGCQILNGPPQTTSNFWNLHLFEFRNSGIPDPKKWPAFHPKSRQGE